jgi:hypothetical protein
MGTSAREMYFEEARFICQCPLMTNVSSNPMIEPPAASMIVSIRLSLAFVLA